MRTRLLAGTAVATGALGAAALGLSASAQAAAG